MSAYTEASGLPARRRPLKVGIFLPFNERQMAGATARWVDLLAMARRAEEAGFDSVWVADHLLFRFGPRTLGVWECWSMLAALAAATTRIELGPLVSCTSFRNPALLAKMADTVDEISGGRLVLGLGAGWNEDEFRAFGYPYDHRVGRFEEALTIIATLLREGRIDFDGTYYQARECELRPRGPRPQGPPILIGAMAHAERMLRLTATHADQWNAWLAFGRSRPDEIPPLRDKVDAACRAAGRDPAALARTVTVTVDLIDQPDSRPTFAQRGVAQVPLTGSPDALAEQLTAFAREGISHVQVALHPNSLAGIEAFAPVLDVLDRGETTADHPR